MRLHLLSALIRLKITLVTSLALRVVTFRATIKLLLPPIASRDHDDGRGQVDAPYISVFSPPPPPPPQNERARIGPE